MKTLQINTDYNGIVFFDPVLLKSYFGGSIEDGENLFELFTTTEHGDAVLSQGIVLPILAIDDGGYDINFLVDESFIRSDDEIVFKKEIFPLTVKSRLVVADLVVLRDWSEELGWIDTDIPKGTYEVSITGFRIQEASKEIINCGYDIHLKTVTSLPELTADMNSSNRVMVFV